MKTSEKGGEIGTVIDNSSGRERNEQDRMCSIVAIRLRSTISSTSTIFTVVIDFYGTATRASQEHQVWQWDAYKYGKANQIVKVVALQFVEASEWHDQF